MLEKSMINPGSMVNFEFFSLFSVLILQKVIVFAAQESIMHRFYIPLLLNLTLSQSAVMFCPERTKKEEESRTGTSTVCECAIRRLRTRPNTHSPH